LSEHRLAILELVEPVQELVGSRDAQKPLFEIPALPRVQRQHFPSITCSFARTVLSVGHQLTAAFLR
jgi:hypothetical protein